MKFLRYLVVTPIVLFLLLVGSVLYLIGLLIRAIRNLILLLLTVFAIITRKLRNWAQA